MSASESAVKPAKVKKPKVAKAAKAPAVKAESAAKGGRSLVCAAAVRLFAHDHDVKVSGDVPNVLAAKLEGFLMGALTKAEGEKRKTLHASDF